MADKIAVITGAGQGAGQAIAEKLAAGGFRVVLVGRTAEKLQATAARIGKKTVVYTMDVTQSAEVTRFAEFMAEQYQQVDVLVNSAGEAFITPLEQSSDDDWDRILNVNLKAPFLMTRAFLPMLRKSDNASIINMVSKVALEGHEGVTVYTAAKTGLLGFTRSLAAELRPDEIRAIALCPGAMDTPMRWSATPDMDRKKVINTSVIADMVWYLVNLPKGVSAGEIMLESVHYG